MAAATVCRSRHDVVIQPARRPWAAIPSRSRFSSPSLLIVCVFPLSELPCRYTVGVLQVLAQVGRTASGGLPPLLASLLRALAATQLQDVALPGPCLKLYPFASEVQQCSVVLLLSLGLWGWLVSGAPACVRCSNRWRYRLQQMQCGLCAHSPASDPQAQQAEAGQEVRTRSDHFGGATLPANAALMCGRRCPTRCRKASILAQQMPAHASRPEALRPGEMLDEGLRKPGKLRFRGRASAGSGFVSKALAYAPTAAFTLCSLLYALVANSVFKLLHCTDVQLSPLAYALLNRDLHGESVNDAVARVVAAGPAAMSTLVTARVLYADPTFECWSGDHRPAAALAVVTLVLFVIGYPVWSLLWLRARINWLMLRSFVGFPSGSFVFTGVQLPATWAALATADAGAVRAMLVRFPCWSRLLLCACGRECASRALSDSLSDKEPSAPAGTGKSTNRSCSSSLCRGYLAHATRRQKQPEHASRPAAAPKVISDAKDELEPARTDTATCKASPSPRLHLAAACASPDGSSMDGRFTAKPRLALLEAVGENQPALQAHARQRGGGETSSTTAVTSTAANAIGDRVGAQAGSCTNLLEPGTPSQAPRERLLRGSLQSQAMDSSSALQADQPLSHFIALYRPSTNAKHVDLACLAALAALQALWPRPTSPNEAAFRGAANVTLLLVTAWYFLTRHPFKRDSTWKLWVRVGSLLLCALAAVLTHFSLTMALRYPGIYIDQALAAFGVDVELAGGASSAALLAEGASAEDAAISLSSYERDALVRTRLSYAVFAGCVLLFATLTVGFLVATIEGARLEGLKARKLLNAAAARAAAAAAAASNFKLKKQRRGSGEDHDDGSLTGAESVSVANPMRRRQPDRDRTAAAAAASAIGTGGRLHADNLHRGGSAFALHVASPSVGGGAPTGAAPADGAASGGGGRPGMPHPASASITIPWLAGVSGRAALPRPSLSGSTAGRASATVSSPYSPQATPVTARPAGPAGLRMSFGTVQPRKSVTASTQRKSAVAAGLASLAEAAPNILAPDEPAVELATPAELALLVETAVRSSRLLEPDSRATARRRDSWSSDDGSESDI